MRIVVHDYSGHPGQAQLSRQLARLGHDVVHQHCSSYVTGKGSLGYTPGDPPSLVVEDVPMRGTFRRYAPAVRVLQEALYGFRAAGAIRRARPDVAVLCNIPLLGHFVACLLLRVRRVPMVFWQQDIYSAAIARTAERKLGAIGRLIGLTAIAIERAIARLSKGVVCIAPSFVTELRRWGIPTDKVTVIRNWGPVSGITPRSKDNEWSRRHSLADRPVVLYSGTLGLKHHPAVLLELARWMHQRQPDARMVVVSEGRGRDWLQAQVSVDDLPQLVLLDFQPYGELPNVLAAADVVLAILEPDASRFSVPSKVLTYLCAGRPVFAVVPEENDIVGVVHDGGGIVVPPGRHEEAMQGVEQLLGDPSARQAAGAAARGYAERAFDIETIAIQFERVVAKAAH